MLPQIKLKSPNAKIKSNIKIKIYGSFADINKDDYNTEEYHWLKKNIENENNIIEINRYEEFIIVALLKKKKNNDKPEYQQTEEYRKLGNKIYKKCNDILKTEDVSISFFKIKQKFAYAFVEGFVLSCYRFNKYFSSLETKVNKIKNIYVENVLNENDLKEITFISEAVFFARDMVNEPSCYLTAEKFAMEIVKLSEKVNIKTEVFRKDKIISLKMNGLITVNKGSPNEPVFITMEWKPSKYINKKPYIIVGKGIMFDSGGLNIKSGTAMDTMKCDMGGAAAVAGVMYAIALSKLPVHVVGLIPATDNRPSGNAYAPGDIIKMMNNKTVEVISTDAEGRLILADALCYASKYKPDFVIDIATLTGSASVAIGPLGMVGMGNCDKLLKALIECGYDVHERIAEFPFWDEYNDEIKSKVADIKNVGNRFGGAITAGKFLEHFVDYPWVHLDIAGPVFIDSEKHYLSAGGTGIGVRLLYSLFKKIANKEVKF